MIEMTDLISKNALINRLRVEANRISEKEDSSAGQATTYYAGVKRGILKAIMIIIASTERGEDGET